jgi:hypothetical protein
MKAKFRPDERRQRRKIFGTLRDGLRPIRPYRWRIDAEGHDNGLWISMEDWGALGSIRNHRMTRSDRLIAAGLAVGLLSLYLATRLQVHNQGDDFTNYAALIQRGNSRDLSDEAHLIYLWLLSLDFAP